MSIKILTPEEAEHTRQLCEKYGEAFEMVQGIAPVDYICDNSGSKIHAGDQCAVVLVLPSRKHFNYEHQLSMLSNYIL